MNAKILILGILCIVVGLIFIISSFYFFAQQNRQIKMCGYVAIALGFITVIWGTMILTFPNIAALLALVYMIVLILAFIVLYVMFRINQ